MPVRKLTLGIFGFGCVGQGLYETLHASGFSRANVKRVCIKDPTKDRSIDDEIFTVDPDDILEDPSIDVVVELIDDAEAAYGIVTRALRNGKDVVTANKKLIAENLSELIKLQEETGRSLLYEAACCASIPVIRNLEEYYDNDLVHRVEGIFNGSTNFILNYLQSGERSFDEVLKEAQERGFAETDPTLDIEGVDPVYKLTLLLVHAFGLVISPQTIPHLGITSLSPEAFKRAGSRDQRIKLVGRCWKVEDQVVAYVLPTLIDSSEELFSVNREFNGVVIEGAFSERQFFKGKGAGSWPTGAAVLSDISALTHGYRYEYKKLHHGDDLRLADDHSLWVQLGGPSQFDLPLDSFEEVFGVYRSREESYLEGKIRITNLIALSKKSNWSILALSSKTAEKYEAIVKSKEEYVL